MRSVNLLRIAAEAEVLRYRCMAARQGRRAAFGAIALLFVLAVLALGEAHGLHYTRVSQRLRPRSFCLASTSSSLSFLACSLRGHRQVVPSVKPCGFGSNRSTPRAGHFHLLPLSRSGTPFCGTGATMADRSFADNGRGASVPLPLLISR